MAGYPFQDKGVTPFKQIYDCFFGKITDDMYLEWSVEDTRNDVLNILMDAIPNFEFPRFHLYAYVVHSDEEREEARKAGEEEPEDYYKCYLTQEEINILALYMLNAWLQRQITSIEHTRQKYSGADFRMTSQANHLEKLLSLKKETERQAFHMQRLYKRRKLIDDQGSIKSNWSTVMEKSTFDG